MNVFKELYNYRELLKNNIKKDVRGKYKGSWLGIVWTFLNPLLQLLVYSIVFPYILRVNVEHYTIFMIVALMPWTFFTSGIQGGSSCVLLNGDILKKVYFPREIIPVSMVTSALVSFFITSIVMFLFVIFGGVGISWYVLLFPVIALIEYILILGFVFILSAIVVFVRDIDHFVVIVLMLAFYITPIIYTPDMIPSKFQWILTINPMTHIIAAYRDALYYQKLPDFASLGTVTAIAFAVLVLGYLLFKKLEKNFVEEL